MMFYAKGSESDAISASEMKNAIFEALDKLGHKNRVLVIPPDFTRIYSKAGELTQYVAEFYGDALTDILPALGTHAPMQHHEISSMFGRVPAHLFRVHNWRNDIMTLGIVPGEYLSEISEGKINYNWSAQVNRLIPTGQHDLILSIGQVVPHEVVGMANHSKNILIGTGGKEGINKSHFLGAVYGMERMMGRMDTPVRKLLNYASSRFLSQYPIIYVLTVVGNDKNRNLVLKGLFIGDDTECFEQAAELSRKVNFHTLPEPLQKVVVYLDPAEFKSTWLGNKSIYRTRMALANEGELIVMAPGLREFGEDREIDRLIRSFGYSGTDRILEITNENTALQNNLSAAAHLIHGSTENRFNVTYCPGHLSREEIESVNYKYAPLQTMMKKYNPSKLKDGFNEVDGEKIFYISHPSLGLWAARERLI